VCLLVQVYHATRSRRTVDERGGGGGTNIAN